MIEVFTVLIILFLLIAILFKLFFAKSAYEKILLVNVFGSLTVILLVGLAYFMKYAEVIDIAIIYALINFVGVVAMLKYFKYKSFK